MKQKWFIKSRKDYLPMLSLLDFISQPGLMQVLN